MFSNVQDLISQLSNLTKCNEEKNHCEKNSPMFKALERPKTWPVNIEAYEIVSILRLTLAQTSSHGGTSRGCSQLQI